MSTETATSIEEQDSKAMPTSTHIKLAHNDPDVVSKFLSENYGKHMVIGTYHKHVGAVIAKEDLHLCVLLVARASASHYMHPPAVLRRSLVPLAGKALHGASPVQLPAEEWWDIGGWGMKGLQGWRQRMADQISGRLLRKSPLAGELRDHAPKTRRPLCALQPARLASFSLLVS